jgi:hypothetical protein
MNEELKRVITKTFEQVAKTILSVNAVVDLHVKELKRLDERLTNLEDSVEKLLPSIPKEKDNKE